MQDINFLPINAIYTLYGYLVLCLQDLIWTKVGNSKKQGSNVAKWAEVKLLTILVYYIITTVISLVLLSYTSSITPNLYLGALFPYFTCESTGHDESKDCTHLLSKVQQPQLFNLSRALSVLVGLLPVVLFLFSTDFKLYSNLIKKIYKKMKGSRRTILISLQSRRASPS